MSKGRKGIDQVTDHGENSKSFSVKLKAIHTNCLCTFLLRMEFMLQCHATSYKSMRKRRNLNR